MTERNRYSMTRRPRRLRVNQAIRSMVEETEVRVKDLIMPLFVIEGDGLPESVDSMPGQCRWPLRKLVDHCGTIADLGIPAVALFPSLDPSLKDARGSQALNENTLVLKAVRKIKSAYPDLLVITDVALDPYTNHGHDGLLSEAGDEVLNDETVSILAQMAVVNARAGVDLVAPSDMMDGRVSAIREALDEAGFENTGILAYSAKFASSYYGPFRDAVGSASAAGTHLLDKYSYQINPANRREALVETALDEAEGADILMVKPAGPFLDIIRELRDSTELPVAAYQVSGEYAQIHAAARLGWLDLERSRDESVLGIKRAGADMILTYFAIDMAKKFL